MTTVTLKQRAAQAVGCSDGLECTHGVCRERKKAIEVEMRALVGDVQSAIDSALYSFTSGPSEAHLRIERKLQEIL